MKIETEVRSLQDLMRRDPGLDGDAQRLEQLVWLVLLRVCTSAESPLDLTDIPAGLRWEAWARNRSGDTEGFPEFVDAQVLRPLRQLTGPVGAPLAELLSAVRNRMTNGQLLSALVERVDNWSLASADDMHQIGSIYEHLVSAIGGAGNAGEFYTPRSLTGLMAQLTRIRPGETVLDPASGTGGMLISALEVAAAPIRVAGIEKKALPHLLGATNLVLHGVTDLAAITRGNLLLTSWRATAPDYDVVLSNPPFGGVEEPGVDTSTPGGIRTQETLDLFMARIPRLLAPGGRAAVVVPDGFLFGSGAKVDLRRQLVDDLRLDLVLRFPGGVFSPYTGIASNVLLFSRNEPADSFWLYEVPPPRGTRAFSRTRPLGKEQLDPFLEWWARPVENERAALIRTEFVERHAYSLDVRVQRSKAVSAGDSIQAAKASEAARAAALAALAALTAEVAEHAQEPLSSQLSALLAQKALTIDRPQVPGELERILRLAGVTGWLTAPLSPGQSAAAPALITPKEPSPRARKLPLDLRELRFAPGADWAWAPLAAYGPLQGGGTPDTREDGVFSDSSGVPWVTPADLRGHSGAYVERGRRYLTARGFEVSAAKLVPIGSVLFSTRAPIGYVAIAGVPLATNQGFRSIQVEDDRVSRYLYYFLSAVAPLVDGASSGTTFKEVSGSQLAGLEVPVPTLDEMAAIAGTLDRVSAAITLWEERVAEYLECQTVLERVLAQAADVSSAV